MEATGLEVEVCMVGLETSMEIKPCSTFTTPVKTFSPIPFFLFVHIEHFLRDYAFILLTGKCSRKYSVSERNEEQQTPVQCCGSGCDCISKHFFIYEVYQKVPRRGQKRNAGLSYSILAAISFKIVPIGMCTAIPSFFPCFKSTVEVIILNAVEYRLRFPFDVRHSFVTSYLQFYFQFGKQSEITGG
jgi:hypothetical protein